jgi:hypothetical protein|tara:strand:+ start:825 stop:992 length:168 start_codon:yes stop_codon:yes gene_type:complete
MDGGLSMEEKLDELINLEKANNALLTEIKEYIKVFSDFVLEVKPQDAREEIEKLK